MRCILVYRFRWSRSGLSGGSLDFGVSSEADPRIEREKAALEARNAEVIAIRFW